MPVIVTWDDDAHTTILLSYQASWVWDDLHAGYQQVMEMAAEVSHPIHTIHEIQVNVTSRTSPAPHVKHLLNNLPENIGMIVVVIYVDYLRKLANFSLQLASSRIDYLKMIDFTDSIEAARELIQTKYNPEK